MSQREQKQLREVADVEVRTVRYGLCCGGVVKWRHEAGSGVSRLRRSVVAAQR